MLKTIQTRTHLKESALPVSGSSKFSVILIQEGLGNLRDCFYYTKDCLKNAVQLFNGKKCYGDHTTSVEQEVRPERSTKDILGYYESLEYRESEDGRGMIAGILTIPDGESFDWARDRMKASLDYAQKFPESDFVGLSIDASGKAQEVPIHQFLGEAELPSSVLPKLQEAQTQGIQEIKVVSELSNCESCDLVTEAGAGGKILQMIEQERKPMFKESKEKKETKEKKEAHEGHEGKEKAKENEQEALPDHEDEEQDKKLISQMIKQYLGDDHEEDQEAHEVGKHAYEACQADGMSHEMAYEAAGKHLQMSKKIGKKMHQAMQAKQAMEAGVEAEKKECEGEMPPMMKKKTENHESAGSLQKQLLQAHGMIAQMKESLKKYELSDYLDKKLKESKKTNEFTKKFREQLGQPKSKSEIDQLFKFFLAGAESVSMGEMEDFSSFSFTEKTSFKESAAGAEGSFADCLSE